jgi:hypothetical protein
MFHRLGIHESEVVLVFLPGRLALVWYHATIRPFFSLDGKHLSAGKFVCLFNRSVRILRAFQYFYGGTLDKLIFNLSNNSDFCQNDLCYVNNLLVHICAGVEDASRILEKALKEYPESALLLYFRCRIYRLQVTGMRIYYDVKTVRSMPFGILFNICAN